MPPGWAAVVTEPQAEARAVANVGKLGYAIFYPKIIRRLRLRGRRVQVICPLFPGYFFTWIELRWTDLLQAYGIAGLLMDGEKVAIVREDEMRKLKGRCDRNGVYLDPPRVELSQGQKVRVQTGVLAGRVGIFDGLSGQHEVALFDLFGTRTRVLLKEGSLSAI